jgi:hypothetical protein
MKKKLLLPVLTMLLFTFSCEEPLDPIIKSVNSTNKLLQENIWNLEEFTISVKHEDIPPPILFGVAGSILNSGIYGLDEMVLDATEMKDYTVNFTLERHMITSNGQIDVLGDSIASY